MPAVLPLPTGMTALVMDADCSWRSHGTGARHLSDRTDPARRRSGSLTEEAGGEFCFGSGPAEASAAAGLDLRDGSGQGSVLPQNYDYVT